MRNFLLGAIHSLLRYTDSKNAIISILLMVEIVFQAVFVVQSTCKVFRKMIKFWFYAMLSFTRILLIITFYFEHRSSYGSLLQEVQVALILVNIVIYVLSVAVLVCQSANEVLKFVLVLTPVNKPVGLSTPFQGTIKSRIFTLRRIARQNQMRGEVNMFETKGE